MRVRVKICGITSESDAHAAVEAGADALGFIFVPTSPRFIPPDLAKSIIDGLPPFVAKVGVFQNAPKDEVRQIALKTGIDTLQFHGDESPDYCRSFPLKAIRAFRIRGEESIAEISQFQAMTWLLDSYVAGQSGGTGRTFDWDLAIRVAKLGQPLILAGGLTPETVRAAVRKVLPYGVDVSSGVEISPGHKDPLKVLAFVRGAKESFFDPKRGERG